MAGREERIRCCLFDVSVDNCRHPRVSPDRTFPFSENPPFGGLDDHVLAGMFMGAGRARRNDRCLLAL